MPDSEQLAAVVRGYVQGVGFRAFAARQARALGLAGWVRNRSDGGVEVVAEGARANLLALLERLRQGPADAEVQDVEETWRPFSGSYATFEVRF